MALGLALQAAIGVEVGLTDDQIGDLGFWSTIAAAAGSVLGGLISDRTGHRRTLAVYVLLTLVPTGTLAYTMQTVGWILPVDPTQPGAPTAPEQLVQVFWWATLAYGFFTGLINGTRMAIFMKVCSPRIAATQFTLYMAASNLAISYSAAWQGWVVENWGYPQTLALDCAAGLACLAILPFLTPGASEPDTPLPAEPKLA